MACAMFWGYTELTKDKLKKDIHSVGGEDIYKGRHLIHRDSPIDGGIYTTPGSESIVVDSKKYHEIEKLYAEAKQRATENGVIKNSKIVDAVYDTVEHHMKYNAAAVDRIIAKCGVEHNGKIAIDSFIQMGVGVCRHMAVASGELMELFKRDGYIKSDISVDRNSNGKGGHAWCRVKRPDKKIWVIDVAQHYKGPLDAAPREKRWEYERPEDY